MLYKCIIFGLISLGICNSNNAQTIAPFYKKLSVEDGLPSSTTFFVIQDSKGYIWIATDHGVARYNGYEFKVFTSNDGLEDNTVFHLFEDKIGRIWMLTFSGKIYYYQNEKIFSYKYNDVSRKFVVGKAASKIFVDAAENVYIEGRGEIKIDTSGNLTHEINFSKPNTDGILIHEFTDDFFMASPNHLKPPTEPSTVYYRKDNGIDSIFSIPGSITKTNAVRINQHEMVITINSDIYFFKDDSVIQISTGLFENINFLTKDSSGRIYACANNGLYIYNDIKNPQSLTTHFNGKIVTGCTFDNEGGFWVTTRDDGVYYLPGFNVNYLKNSDEEFSKPVRIITDHKKNIYASYWSGLVTQITGTSQQVIYKTTPPTQVYNLYLNESNKLYIASNVSGYLYNNRFTQIYGNLKNGFTNAHLKNNFIFRKDGFLYNAAQSGIFKIRNDTLLSQIQCGQRINCLFETKKDQLILGCLNGVLLLSDSGRKVSSFIPTLDNKCIQDISQFHNSICFATMGYGLMFYDGIKIISLTERNGLVSNLINKIFVHQNDIWVATGNGLSHIHFSDVQKFKYTVRNITTKEGLTSNEINDITYLNDTIWLATNAGICFFNFNYDFTNTVKPQIYITGIHINGNDTAIRSHYELPYDYNNLKISFEGLSFKSQADITYRYILKTGNDSIVGVTKNRDVDFLSLNSGNYSFTVYSKNSSGVWSQQSAMLTFVIQPAWWNSWWLKAVLIVILVLVIYIIYKVRLKRLKQKFENERKQADLHLTALRAQMNPHFIFNVMNSIRSYIQKSDIISAQKYLSSFAKLIRYTLDNSAVQEISLQEELNALRIYAELEMQRFENAFEFIIKCDEEIDTDETMIPSLLLQPYVENAIKHGMTYIETNGKIFIEIKKTGKNILIAVEDNGAGRSESLILNENVQIHYTPHGTTLTSDRISAYNKAFGKNISLQIKDLKSLNGNACGTRIEITI